MNSRFLKTICSFSFSVFILVLSTVAYGQEDEYKKAFSAYQTQKFDEANKIWSSLAENGDINAQYALGVMELRGESESPSDEKAFEWFKSAATQGHATAMFNVGVAYWEGSGIQKDRAEALKWWEKSANNGDSGAQFNLGLAYYLGNVRPADMEVATKWIGKAAEQNHPEAKRILRIINEESPDVTTASYQPEDSSSLEVESPQPDPSSPDENESSQEIVSITETPEENNEPKFEFVKTSTATPLRVESESTAAIFTSLPEGTPVEIIDQSGNWSRVTVPDGLKMWVFENFISVNGDKGVIGGTGVRVRPQPSTDNNLSPPVGAYRNGDRVSVIEKDGQWYRIRAPKHVGGWVLTQNLEEYRDTEENRNQLWELMLARGL